MDTHSTSTRTPNRLARFGAAAAIALGLGVGSYGIASAASGTSTTTTTQAAAPAQSNGASPSNPWGHQRSDETLVTGDALAKVTAIANAKAPGATIIRVETDADGVAAYEAHLTKSDGTAATVYVDKDFNFVSIETR